MVDGGKRWETFLSRRAATFFLFRLDISRVCTFHTPSFLSFQGTLLGLLSGAKGRRAADGALPSRFALAAPFDGMGPRARRRAAGGGVGVAAGAADPS